MMEPLSEELETGQSTLKIDKVGTILITHTLGYLH